MTRAPLRKAYSRDSMMVKAVIGPQPPFQSVKGSFSAMIRAPGATPVMPISSPASAAAIPATWVPWPPEPQRRPSQT